MYSHLIIDIICYIMHSQIQLIAINIYIHMHLHTQMAHTLIIDNITVKLSATALILRICYIASYIITNRYIAICVII